MNNQTNVAATPLQPIVMASVPKLTLPKPYFEKDGITIYHGDCQKILPLVSADVLVTDPPYGISHKSNRPGAPRRGKQIENDESTSLRDWCLEFWGERPSVVFGTVKASFPKTYRGVLIWDKGGHVGMGDLSFPWKQNWEMIFVSGGGFEGRRGTGVLHFNAIPPWAGEIKHPHEKPIALMRELVHKCPKGTVVDPFMGSGTTLDACRDDGRKAIGIELEERYCEIAAKRLAQGVLF